MAWMKRPVILVPGWSDEPRVLRRCRDFLVEAGWSGRQVLCMGFTDRYGSNVDHAGELAAAAARLRAEAAVDRVDVVAHSMGGLALRQYVQDGGADVVRTAIFVGTPHRGTMMAYLAWGHGGREMRPGSEFLRRLNARPLPSGVRAHCLRTPIDSRVVPGSSAWLDGAACHTVRLPTHPRMMRHPRTLRLIRSILEDSTPAG